MARTGSSSDSFPSSLVRDYGLTAVLLGVSAWLVWWQTLPQAEETKALDQRRQELDQKIQRQEQRLDALEDLDRAGSDPVVLERFAREYNGGLGLPPDEELADPGAQDGGSVFPEE